MLVTGGAGFLGSHLVERLRARGSTRSSRAARSYDLTDPADDARLFATSQPELVFHLAAEVGGIGANRANPGRYWYANLIMGVHVLEQSRAPGSRKLVMSGRSARIRSSRRCRSARTTSGTAIRRRRTRPTASPRRRLLVGAQAYREQYGLNTDLPAAGESLRPARQLRPRDVARDSGADPQDARGRAAVIEVVLWGDGSPTREFLYVDDCAEGLLLAGRALRRRRAGQPRHRRGDLDPRSRRARRRADRLRG